MMLINGDLPVACQEPQKPASVARLAYNSQQQPMSMIHGLTTFFLHP
jgi:hypothetical protein